MRFQEPAGTILFVCGSRRDTVQMHAIAEALPEYEHWFTPFYCDPPLRLFERSRLLDGTIVGKSSRLQCVEYLCANELQIDMRGEHNDYDLVVTSTDIVVPRNLWSSKVVVVQDGVVRPWSPTASLAGRLHPLLSLWIANLAGKAKEHSHVSALEIGASAWAIADVCRKLLGHSAPPGRSFSREAA